MKKLSLLLLAVLLVCLSGCTAAAGHAGNDEYPPLPDASGEQAQSWSLSIRQEERNVYADDGRLLVQAGYALPQLVEDGSGETLSISEAAAGYINRYFEDWLTKQLEFLDDVAEMAREHYGLSDEDDRWGAGEYCYTDTVTADSWSNGRLLCIQLYYTTYSGGAHPNAWREAVSFDAGAAHTVTIPDLTNDLEGLKTAVTDYLLRELPKTQVWQEQGEDGFFPDYAQTLAEWMDKPLIFGDDGITVVFNAYDIASYAAGEQAFLLPYSLLQPYMNDYAKTLLGLTS